jgi:hypothetical protein
MKWLSISILIGLLCAAIVVSTGQDEVMKVIFGKQKSKSEMVWEIEEYIEGHRKGPCGADDFAAIIKKNLPKKAALQDIIDKLGKNGFDVKYRSGPLVEIGKYEKRPEVGVIIANRNYEMNLFGSKSYAMTIYIDVHKNTILHINTSVSCDLNYPWI